MKTVKVVCEKTEGNDLGYYVCNADQVPKGSSIVGGEVKEQEKSFDYAVMKEGRSKAVRVFDEPETAQGYIDELADSTGYSVKPRARK